MKSRTIKLTKNDAVTIAHLSLIEHIVDRQGIWTFLNERIRSRRPIEKTQRQKQTRREVLSHGA